MDPRHPDVARASRTADRGRTMIEAVVGLTLIALAVLSWGRLATTASRAESTVAHRDRALEVAANTLEALTLTPWSEAVIADGSPGAVARFEGRRTVTGTPGVPAVETVDVDDTTFTVTRHLTNSGDDAWRHAVVVVEWDALGRIASVRLDGAIRRPDGGSS